MVTNDQIMAELTELKRLIGQMLKSDPDEGPISIGQVISMARRREIRRQAEADMNRKLKQ